MEQEFCMGCMRRRKPGEEICPSCGYRHDAEIGSTFSLPTGSILQNGKYLVGKVLGKGGFGITYLALDRSLDTRVAIKEYYPQGQAVRDTDRTSVFWQSSEEEVSAGKEGFLREARKMAKIRSIPGIVRVQEVFYENRTAYIVMDYIDGETLRSMLKQKGCLKPSDCLELLYPVMEAMEEAHTNGMIHRDISPDNIMVDRMGRRWLLDMGAAKEVEALRNGESVSSNAIVKRGFSPPEQYMDRSSIGIWSDVYAMCATIYYCVTGAPAQDAVDRMMEDRLSFPNDFPKDLEAALTRGLALRPAERIQTMAQLEAELKACRCQELNSVSAELKKQEEEETSAGKYPEKPMEPPLKIISVLKSTVPESEQETAQRKYEQEEEKSTGKKQRKTERRARKKWPILAAAILFVVAILALVITDGAGKLGSDSGSSSGSFQNETVTTEMIQALSKKEDTTYVSFYHCVLPDEVIAELAKNSLVRSLSFHDCEGFRDLSPLSEMAALSSLTVFVSGDGESALNVSSLFHAPFHQLRSLSLRGLDCSDSDFLKMFPELTSLFLYEFRSVPELESISELSSLRTLELNGCDLSAVDLSPISTCTELNHLELNSCGISELSWAAPLEKLATVYLNDNQISDISAISGMTKLTYLAMNNNQVEEILALSGKTALRKLEMENNRIEDISPLAECTGLQELNLANNRIAEVSACEKLIMMEDLDLHGNKITELKGLENTTQIHTLNLTRNQIENLEPISKNAVKLKLVFLGENRIRSILPLRGAENLQILAIHSNLLESLDGLEDSVNLKVLYAHDNQLRDISALKGFSALSHVDLAENLISDISPLMDAVVKNQVLFLQHNQISDLSCLNALVNYQYLYLYDNPLVELSDLKTLKTLQSATIAVSWNEKTDYQPLFVSKFQTIRVADVPLDRQMPLNNQFREDSGRDAYYLKLLTTEELDAEVQEQRIKFGEKNWE